MGWVASKWGTSDNNRRAKFYSITRAGKKQLLAEAKNWERISDILGRFLKPSKESA
jgi:DNA-binding PadR family transcriptional regulator